MKWSTPKQHGHCSVTTHELLVNNLVRFRHGQYSVMWGKLCEFGWNNIIIIFKKIIIICTRRQDRNSSLLDESPFYIHHHLDLLLMLSFSLFIFHHLTSSFAGVFTTMATRGLCRTFSIWSSEDSLIIQLSRYMQNIPDLYFWVF